MDKIALLINELCDNVSLTLKDVKKSLDSDMTEDLIGYSADINNAIRSFQRLDTDGQLRQDITMFVRRQVTQSLFDLLVCVDERRELGDSNYVLGFALGEELLNNPHDASLHELFMDALLERGELPPDQS